MIDSVAHRRVPASALLLEERWDAAIHVRALAGGPGWITIGELAGRVVEGVRGATGPVFRPSDLVELAMAPAPAHFGASGASARDAVGPGDVVLSKLFPVRAAVVTAAVPRIPVDANCARIIGLTAGWALWVAAMFAHPTFETSLLHIAAGRVLPRIGVRDLFALGLPAPLREVDGVAVEWGQAVEDQILATREIDELRLEVQQYADETAPAPPDARAPRFVPAKLLPSAWLPDHVARARYAADLADCGWQALADLLVPEPERLRRQVPPIRVLRLSDADASFGFHLPALEPAPEPLFRLFAQPLHADEVLMSTLGSAPKVVFHHPPADGTVWLPDTWARLRCHPTAGALALALTTRQVVWQLERSATGVVQQYVGREELGLVRVPVLPSDAADRVHRRLCAALERRKAARARIAALRGRLDMMITRSLASTETA